MKLRFAGGSISVLMKFTLKNGNKSFLPYQSRLSGILSVSSEPKLNVVHYERQTGTNSDFLMLIS